MSLASLFNRPTNESDTLRWAFSNSAEHAKIIRAIRQQLNITTLQTFILDPIPAHDKNSWLLRHQVVHNQMNAVTGVNGNDLSVVDFNNPEELQAWIDLHAQEHYQTNAILGI